MVSLEAFGYNEFKPAFMAACAIIDYILETQKGFSIKMYNVLSGSNATHFLRLSLYLYLEIILL